MSPSMRITNQTIVDAVVRNLNAHLERLDELQRQLTSGKRLTRPSDDPAALGLALTYRSAIETGKQYLRTMDGATAWLNATDSALGSASDLLQNVRTLAVQGGNDSLGQSERDALATQVDQLLNQLVDVGNSTFQGQRLFAGLKTDTVPFSLNAGPPTTVSYQGDNGAMLREIDLHTSVSINVPGSTAFPAAFAALVQLRDDLRSGNSAAIRGADLSSVDSALNGVLATRADVGARVNRVEAASAWQQKLQVHLTELLTKTEDVDYTEAITKFTTEETVYKAALQAGTYALQPSLMDYLK
ncbi:MAG: flagellar hook-associated protein FlgL [Chloroflexi bacterium]|nr:flagellar hook-associated protein FlgL [Chloroflexota bacterium]